jgi:hypothetical protein
VNANSKIDDIRRNNLAEEKFVNFAETPEYFDRLVLHMLHRTEAKEGKLIKQKLLSYKLFKHLYNAAVYF